MAASLVPPDNSRTVPNRRELLRVDLVGSAPGLVRPNAHAYLHHLPIKGLVPPVTEGNATMDPLGLEIFRRQQAAYRHLLSQFPPQAQDTFNAAQDYIQQVNAARAGLRNLGILRSENNISGDYAEWLAARLLGLELATSGVQKGYDALDSEGRRYQVKSRIVTSLRDVTSFDFRALDLELPAFEYLIGVFFSYDLDVLGIIKVPFEAVHELSARNNGSVRFRWSGRNPSDSRIERLIWHPELERDGGAISE